MKINGTSASWLPLFCRNHANTLHRADNSGDCVFKTALPAGRSASSAKSVACIFVICIMAKSNRSEIPDEKIAVFDRIIADIPNLERKGASIPYTSLNGNMFSLFTKDGIFALRLSEENREKFISKYKSRLHEAYGAVLKEYVVVPDALFSKPAELKKWFNLSYGYVKSLKPKASRKK